jgi:predicted transposase YdaD
MNPNIPQKEKTYDDLFKEILETFPTHRIIAFLNSTFNHTMPADSAIEPLRTESNVESRRISDYILKVIEPDGVARYFHIEAQTGEDGRMAFRMVEYGLRFALQRAGTRHQAIHPRPAGPCRLCLG